MNFFLKRISSGFKLFGSIILVFIGVLVLSKANAQITLPFHRQHNFRAPNSFFQNDTLPNFKKSRYVTGIALGGYSLSMLYLGTSWYANEDLGSFHFFDDSKQWLQMDKVGHVYGAYYAGNNMISLYKWAGQPKKKAILMGGTMGFLAMTSIEVFDGFGEDWGFSWSDVGANFMGTALIMGNQALWNENRISLKYSYRPSFFVQNDSLQSLFGSTPLEWILKDYNGQTTWMSFRVHSFLPEGKFKEIYPRWLNLAVGYGGEGMTGGYGDPARADRIAREEYRQYYLALDVDLANIKTRSGALRTLFQMLNMVRLPLPAVRYDRNGLAWRWWQ
ncbi:MAG: DUF2279 domain-containing protein [Bacteroidota bacterium]